MPNSRLETGATQIGDLWDRLRGMLSVPAAQLPPSLAMLLNGNIET
jgi:hypothetical protein